jgi:hypothetical protein
VVRNLRSSTRGNVGRREAHVALLAETDNETPFLMAFHASSAAKTVAEMMPPPSFWKDMIKHPESEGFQDAARDEIKALRSRNTFQMVRRPADKQILPLKWVFTYKTNPEGILVKHKARICVRGDLQRGVPMDVTAATGHFRTLRVLLSLAAAFDLEIIQMDAILAFVNAPLDEEVYVNCPPGFDTPGHCWKLLKALYGLKRSPMLWQRELAKTLSSLTLVQSNEDYALFVHPDKPLIVFVYVDDFLLLAPSSHLADLHQLRDQLKATYSFRDLGNVTSFLGLRITRDRKARRLYITMDKYIEQKVVELGLETWIKDSVATPLGLSTLEPYDDVASREAVLEYQRKAGSLLYPAIIARPDIAFAASKLCQFMANPSPTHQRELNRALVYLYNTRHLSLCYSNTGPAALSSSDPQFDPYEFAAASDASFADNEDRKSTHGMLLYLFGGPIAWKSGKQASVTTSTTEAELHALSFTGRETMSIQRLFDDIGLVLDNMPDIACDNKQTVRLINASMPQVTTKLRHVAIGQFWMRQEVQRGHFGVSWLPTDEMPADGLTKPLTREKHNRFVNALGLVNYH